MLAEAYPLENLRQSLLSRQRWHPYPTAGEREAWEALPVPLRQAHILRGEVAQGRPWRPFAYPIRWRKTRCISRCRSRN